MSRRSRGGVTARLWLALAATACAALVVLVPSLMMTTAADSRPLTLALMTVVLAALVRLDLRSVALAAADAHSSTPRAGDGAPLVLTGRVTDPVHHPLRPRAPGTA
jgi:alpha-beta hydrolase superfamily lysophospholipase